MRGRQGLRKLCDLWQLLHIKEQRQDLGDLRVGGLQGLLQRIEPLLAPAEQDELRSRLGESPGRGLTDPSGRLQESGDGKEKMDGTFRAGDMYMYMCGWRRMLPQ